MTELFYKNGLFTFVHMITGFFCKPELGVKQKNEKKREKLRNK